MAANREACFAALYARIAAVAGWQFTSRVWQSWDETAPSMMPAFFLTKRRETPTVEIGLPSMWSLEADAIVYVRRQIDIAPSTQLNDLITAIEDALQRKPIDGPAPDAKFSPLVSGGSFGTTLGGLCYSCQITGSVETFEGLVDGEDAMAIIPIVILTTA